MATLRAIGAAGVLLVALVGFADPGGAGGGTTTTPRTTATTARTGTTVTTLRTTTTAQSARTPTTQKGFARTGAATDREGALAGMLVCAGAVFLILSQVRRRRQHSLF